MTREQMIDEAVRRILPLYGTWPHNTASRDLECVADNPECLADSNPEIVAIRAEYQQIVHREIGRRATGRFLNAIASWGYA